MFELLENGQILKVSILEEIDAKIKEHYCMQKAIKATAEKTNLLINEELTITLQWQTFDIEQGVHVNDTTNTEKFIVDIEGTRQEITPVNGAAQIAFASETEGEFVIRTVNLNTDNAEIKVVVASA
ncbi:MAG: hypothetical protein H0Z40_01555 [Desulfotomaculum sp.]|nr:hypothetical protein [Desulfotomaculum sp.]